MPHLYGLSIPPDWCCEGAGIDEGTAWRHPPGSTVEYICFPPPDVCTEGIPCGKQAAAMWQDSDTNWIHRAPPLSSPEPGSSAEGLGAEEKRYLRARTRRSPWSHPRPLRRGSSSPAGGCLPSAPGSEATSVRQESHQQAVSESFQRLKILLFPSKDHKIKHIFFMLFPFFSSLSTSIFSRWAIREGHQTQEVKLVWLLTWLYNIKSWQ